MTQNKGRTTEKESKERKEREARVFSNVNPASLDTALGCKYGRLIELIRSSERTAIAFSGGVDSTFLLKAWKDSSDIPPLAVFVRSEIIPEREAREAEELASAFAVTLEVLTLNSLNDEEFVQNRPDRCYVCKNKIFSAIQTAARSKGYDRVVDASNADDDLDYRPGMKALRELGVSSPLKEAGLIKSDIRTLSRLMGLPTWDKPSMACLASRFPYGDPLTEEALRRVERAEEILHDRGFSQYRVRCHRDVARIEVPPGEMSRLLEPDVRDNVLQQFRDLGFAYVTIDLQGYRTGSLNETL
ncbi:MAG: ATP-dependent sacrificial sulfur transferase LarE [Candidatus Aminicenantes bacterium]|nr:ATP-dependent sacrificial sulfur transferase LarE [Candidatus Aminicenantes bacterium]